MRSRYADAVKQVESLIGRHASIQEIFDNFHSACVPHGVCVLLRETYSNHGTVTELLETINETYINQSSYWLTYFPLRGFLVLFDLAQLMNLFIVSFKTQCV